MHGHSLLSQTSGYWDKESIATNNVYKAQYGFESRYNLNLISIFLFFASTGQAELSNRTKCAVEQRSVLGVKFVVAYEAQKVISPCPIQMQVTSQVVHPHRKYHMYIEVKTDSELTSEVDDRDYTYMASSIKQPDTL